MLPISPSTIRSFLGSVLAISVSSALAEETRIVGIPETIQDPAVPMIALPTSFVSQRSNSDRRIPSNGRIDIGVLKGPGCVRRIWLLPGNDVRLVVHVDEASQPQIDMPLKPFFGVMHGLEPYFIDCAAYTVLPNPAPGVPGIPGYNLHLPIPFRKSCRLSLRGPAGQRAVAMIDWQSYGNAAPLTPFRLHATHVLHKPGPPRGSFVEMANIEGTGFIAGVAAGYIQQDHSDMVFHTGGMTLLIDGESQPHAIRGHNVEDDFGFTWGFNDRQTRWIGCPYHVNRGRLDQDGVFYRFFGPDPIAFQSSLLFRTGSRGDDMETVVYYYKISETAAPSIVSPRTWQVVGLFSGADTWDGFQRQEFVEEVPPGEWPQRLTSGELTLPVTTLKSVRGWIDLQHVFFERHHTATPLTILNHAAYLRTTLVSDRDRQAQLRLAIDDWATLWLNGSRLADLKHTEGLQVASLPIQLERGNNELRIKTSNSDTPRNKRLWAVHCVVD